MSDTLDYYSILGVSKTASIDEIRKAYLKQSLRWHPDKVSHEEKQTATDKFSSINEAYEVLSNEQKRSQYDMFGKNQQPEWSNTGFNPQNIFNQFMGGNFGNIFGNFINMNNAQQTNVQKQEVKVFINLELAYKGGIVAMPYNKNIQCKTCNGKGGGNILDNCPKCKGAKHIAVTQNMGPIKLMVNVPCNQCHATGQSSVCNDCHGNGLTNVQTSIELNIPRGTCPGHNIKLEKLGSENKETGEPSDLNIILMDDNNGKFNEWYRDEKSPEDLHVKLTLTLSEAICGWTREIKLLDNTMIDIRWNKCSTPNSRFKISDYGFFINGTDKRGNLILDIEIKWPETVPNSEEIWKCMGNDVRNVFTTSDNLILL